MVADQAVLQGGIEFAGVPLEELSKTSQGQVLLDDITLKAITEASNYRTNTELPEYQSSLNELLNQASLNALQLPVNPRAIGANVLGGAVGGLGSTLASGATGAALGSTVLPGIGTAAGGLLGLGLGSALSGFNRANNQAVQSGMMPNPIASAIRGIGEGSLAAFMPTAQTTGQLLRNVGVAGLGGGLTSGLSQAVQNGTIGINALLSDIAAEAGGQLGGDALDAALKSGFRGIAPTGIKQTLKPKQTPQQVQLEGGVLKGGVEANALDEMQEMFNNTLAQLHAFAQFDDKKALKLASMQAKQANMQAARAGENSVLASAYRQQARGYNQFIADMKTVSAETKLYETLQNDLDSVDNYTANNSIRPLKALQRKAEMARGKVKNPDAKAVADALYIKTTEALQTLDAGPKPKAVKAVKQALTAEQKLLAQIEKVEADYQLVRGANGEKVENGSASLKRLRAINTTAGKVSTDSTAPEWVREYAALLKAQTDEDIKGVMDLQAVKKAISQAKERTSIAAEQRAQKQDVPVGLKGLRRDIEARTKAEEAAIKRNTKAAVKAQKEIEAEKVRAAKAKLQEEKRKSMDEARALAIKKGSEAKPQAGDDATRKAKQEVTRLFNTYKTNLKKVHEGMTETPQAIKAKLDDAIKEGEVYEIRYYAENVGASANKDLETRFVTIESAGADKQGRRFYRTIDQLNGTIETRKLFDGVSDSRILSAELSTRKPTYTLDEKGENVVNIKTGEVSTFERGESIPQSQINAELKRVNDAATVGQKIKDASFLMDKIEKNKAELLKKIRGLPESERQEFFKNISGDDC